MLIELRGTVVKGFGRGSKTLGIPTANLDEASLKKSNIDGSLTGIYAGFATVGNDATVYDAVLSIGWNPQFQNTHKTAETWILHTFENDFYGEQLNVKIVAYLRPEAVFDTIDELVQAIHKDAKTAIIGLLNYKHVI